MTCINRSIPRLVVGAWLALALSGCGSSPPVHFHTLVPPAETGRPVGEESRITVEAVTVPPQVDRTALVLRADRSQLQVLESDWWGAPLPQEIQSALTVALNPAEAKDSGVHAWVRITRFEAMRNDQAWLDAEIRLDNRNPDARLEQLTCATRLQSDTGPTVTDTVLAQQANLAGLADRIRAQARRLLAGDDTCLPPA
ncbi:hypothetical protein EZI54_20170 [Marinobacter halodurans]|uniref:ABC-type transport auxiliary lipoprotein component domain-containing protein n=1 Tax=Marinobacter halodurans TaxID=2528979 RepID=A0ABY1ZJ41_9GAMM|nr:ABC-type transport auxiliary lipoprotein family protein [Marinobacter halodurans]TBW49092.1 hypothetical protein EZI54_20170 [Marinobacter halodurans]